MAQTSGIVVAHAAETGTDFGWLFREEYPRIVRTAYLMVGEREAAEDIAQEAFARLYARWARVSRYDRPGAWVRRVAIRLAARAIQRRRFIPLVEPPAVPAGRDPDLHRALLQLPHAQRAAVVLHYLEDRPVDDVAALMGCSPSTAKVHLHRGRKRLAALLGEEDHDVAR